MKSEFKVIYSEGMCAMENKKLRIGLISENSSDSQKLKTEFPDTYVTHAKNVIELHRQCGQNKLNAIVFLNFPELKKDFFSFLNFLRSKNEFQQLPIAILSDEPLVLPRPLKDPLVRTFQLQTNLFLPLLNFFNSLQSEGSLSQLVSQEQIEKDFTVALGAKLGKDTTFLSRVATDDEAHESFICQLSDEICTNLLWIKFSARILDSGSDSLKKMFSGSNESELTEYIERLLSLAFHDFNEKLHLHLQETGAVSFLNTDQMDPKERVLFIKNAKTFPIIFESSVCSILLETSRYI